MEFELLNGLRANLSRWANPRWWYLLITLPWAVFGVLGIYGWTVDGAVAKREEITFATITVHEPANHNRYGYKFFVKGKSYTGWDSPLTQEPQIGQRVTVYYDRNDPATNALTDFTELQLRAFAPLPLIFLGIGAVAFFIFFTRRRNSMQIKP